MSIETSTFASGLRVVTRHMPHATTISVGVWVAAGARDELAHEQGIAHMLEHMAFKGTTKRDAQMIATEVENVGGYMNAHTSREETAYYLRLLPEHLDLGVDILADILTNSTLPEHEIERERGVIVQEIGQSLDTPDDLVFDLFAKSCFDGHTLARPILGTVESVSAFSQADLRAFLSRYYGAGQMLVCAAGAITHKTLASRIEDRLGQLASAESTKRTPAIWQGGRSILTRQLEQAHVVFGLPAVVDSMAERSALMALSILYGGGMSSRLFQQVREKRGLCYSIFSFASLNSDGGTFGVYAGTSAEDVDEMLTVSAAELTAIASAVGDDEVTRAKSQLRASLLMSRESVSSCAEALARQMMLYGRPQHDDELLAAIDRVDGAAVSAIARQMIAAGPPALALVGPKVGVMPNAELAGRLAA